jgi:alpha-1,2-mannosyltransferase
MRSPGCAGAARVAVRVAVVAAVATAGWVLLHHGGKAPWHHYFDLTVYRRSLDSWLDGRPLYDFPRPHARFGFTYPPFAALLLSPLAALSERGARLLHTAACAGVVVVSTWWLMAPVARRAGWTPWFAVGLALPAVFVSDPVRETMGWGQVNLFVVALVLVDVAALQHGRRWAGVGIGLATAVKLTPAVFVVYLLLTRRRRAAAVAAGTFAAATGVAFVLAPQASLQFWGSAVWETSRVGPAAETGNQSVLGLLARLAEPGEPSRLLWVLLAGGLLSVGLWRAVRAAGQGDELVGFTLTGLAGCLISPISWTHHLYWVVPAAVVLLDVAAGAPLSDGTPRLLRGHEQTVRRMAAAAVGAVIAVFCSGLVWIVQSACRGVRCGDPLVLVGEGCYGLVMVALLVLLPVRAPDVRERGAESFASSSPSPSSDRPPVP